MNSIIAEQIKLPVTYTVRPEASHEQAVELRISQAVTQVTNGEELETCIGMGQRLRKRINSGEVVRKELIAPLLDAQRFINRKIQQFFMPEEAELSRLESLANGFRLAEKAKSEEAERQRIKEFARIEAERRAVEERAKRAKSIKAVIAAEQAAEQLREQSHAVAIAPAPVPVTAGGMSARKVMRWKVTDLRALYAHSPHLVHLNPTAAAIQGCWCKPEATAAQPDKSIPGLELWYEETTTIRSR